MLEVLDESRFDSKHSIIIHHVYKNETSSVTSLHGNMEKFKIERRVRQSDTISLKSFTLPLEEILKTLDCSESRININGRLLNLFASSVI